MTSRSATTKKDVELEFKTFLVGNEFLERGTVPRHVTTSKLIDWRIKLNELEDQCKKFSWSTASLSSSSSLIVRIRSISNLLQRAFFGVIQDEFNVFCNKKSIPRNSDNLPLSLSVCTLEYWKRKLHSFVKFIGKFKVNNNDSSGFDIITFKDSIRDFISTIDDRIHSLKDGQFFLSIGDVWIPSATEYSKNVVDLNRTGSFPNNLEYYNVTKREAAERINCVAASSSNYSGSLKKAIAPPNNLDIFSNNEQHESAHMMPASKGRALTWFPVVPWVLPDVNRSKRNTKTYWEFVEKAIIGVYGSANKKGNNNNPNETTSRENPRRIPKTGIKNFPTNLIGLKCQSQYLDNKPCLIIVPIMTVQELQNWKGEGYNAIVLAGEWPINDTGGTTKTKVNEVYKNIEAHYGGTDSDFLASVAEIRKATILLTRVLCTLAGCCLPLHSNMFSKNYDHSIYGKTSSAGVKGYGALYGRTFSQHPQLKSNEFVVPLLSTIIEAEKKNTRMKVRKIVFRPVPEMSDDEQDTMITNDEESKVSTPTNSESSIGDSKPAAVSNIRRNNDLESMGSKQGKKRKRRNSSEDSIKSNQTAQLKDDRSQSDNSQAETNNIAPNNESRPIAPDPTLVVVKAAANWMARNNGYMVASAGPKEYDVDEGSTSTNEAVQASDSSYDDKHEMNEVPKWDDPPLSEIVINMS